MRVFLEEQYIILFNSVYFEFEFGDSGCEIWILGEP